MARLTIRKEDLLHNYRLMREHCGVDVIPVLKANAYGLGAEGVFELLKGEGVSLMAVSRLEEALPLAGRGAEILVLSCYDSEAAADRLLQYELCGAIGSLAFARLLSEKASAAGKRAKVHIKIDTGMGRFGFLPDAIDEIAAVFALPHLEIAGIFSHCYAAFAEDGSAKEQLQAFDGVCKKLEARGIALPMRHLANSSAALDREFALDAVRIGSALSGRLPRRCDLPLRRIGQFDAEIIAVRELPAGSNLGYGGVCRLKTARRVAIVAAGSSDGLLRSKEADLFRFSDICRYLYHDLRLFLKKPMVYGRLKEGTAPMIGRPATNHSFFDVTGIPCAAGDRISIEIPPMKVDATVERIYE